MDMKIKTGKRFDSGTSLKCADIPATMGEACASLATIGGALRTVDVTVTLAVARGIIDATAEGADAGAVFGELAVGFSGAGLASGPAMAARKALAAAMKFSGTLDKPASPGVALRQAELITADWFEHDTKARRKRNEARKAAAEAAREKAKADLKKAQEKAAKAEADAEDAADVPDLPDFALVAGDEIIEVTAEQYNALRAYLAEIVAAEKATASEIETRHRSEDRARGKRDRDIQASLEAVA